MVARPDFVWGGQQMTIQNSSNSPESIHPDRNIANRHDMSTAVAGQGMALSQQRLSAKVTGETIGETAKPVTKKRRRYRARRRRCACGCGAVIEHPKTKRQRFLSSSHRQRHFRKKQRKGKQIGKREQQRDPLWCIHCNSLFWGNPARGQVYCSARCRNLAHRVKRDSAIAALADYIGMDIEKAADIYEIGGMKWVTAMLTGLGLVYSVESRQWFGAVEIATLQQKPSA
jgi:hypothetical protein